MRREGGQVSAAEAGRRGSVGHVEVFRMDGVETSIVGRPRRLSADRRARPTYTLIWEEPRNQRLAGGRRRLSGYAQISQKATVPMQLMPYTECAKAGRSRSDAQYDAGLDT
ncbi:hypothetical protein CXX93_10220 [Gordonia sp. YC-JH1]|nr:hypothetical protein CXX93_10220 [Gordonia sp. YC-JH1]